MDILHPFIHSESPLRRQQFHAGQTTRSSDFQVAHFLTSAVGIRIWNRYRRRRWGADQLHLQVGHTTRPPMREIYWQRKVALLRPPPSHRIPSRRFRFRTEDSSNYQTATSSSSSSSGSGAHRVRNQGGRQTKGPRSIHIRARGGFYDTTGLVGESLRSDATMMMMTSTTHLSLNFRRLWLQFNFPSNTLLIIVAYHHPHVRCLRQERRMEGAFVHTAGQLIPNPDQRRSFPSSVVGQGNWSKSQDDY